MRLLAFDVTAAACSAAVLGGSGEVLAHAARMAERGHSELLMPMLRDVLGAAGTKVGDLGLIAVTTGPGTFTGIRIGLAAARGLALAGGVPLLGVTSFDAVAAAVATEERAGRPLVLAIDSRRADLFVQAFGADVRAPAAVPPDGLGHWAPAGPLLVAGDAAAAAADVLRAAGREASLARWQGPPDAVHVARAALAGWQPNLSMPPPAPFYLRAPDVTRPPAAARAAG